MIGWLRWAEIELARPAWAGCSPPPRGSARSSSPSFAQATTQPARDTFDAGS